MTPLDHDTFRRQLASLEPRLIDAATRLATAIASLPRDPRFPQTPPRALIVGGFVRDALRGGHPKDLDLEVFGVAPEHLDALLQQLYPGIVNAVGRSFGILKIHLGEDVEFDVSIPRRESKTGQRHADFSIEGDPSMSFEDAARRRDFTINAISADVLTGEIIDPFDGISDLRQSCLRVTDPERFQDDPLRVYRAIQFAARMNLTIEPKSFALMREMVARGDLGHLSAERITEELNKLLLRSERPSIGFEIARHLGIIERDYPELHALIDCMQEPEWHPEGDVWTHTMMVIDAAARLAREPARSFSDLERLDVLYGALCHDFGKPATTAFEDGKIRSRGHEAAGEAPTRTFFQRLKPRAETVAYAVHIATQHLKPWSLHRDLVAGHLTDAAYRNNVRKLLMRIAPMTAEMLLAATEADFRGRGIAGVATALYETGDAFRRAVRELHEQHDPIAPLLHGRDLIALGVAEGPHIGELIAQVEALRDAGEIQTRAQALEKAKDLVGL